MILVNFLSSPLLSLFFFFTLIPFLVPPCSCKKVTHCSCQKSELISDFHVRISRKLYCPAFNKFDQRNI